MDDVWYVAYGSNLCAARLACYLQGGRPVGGRLTTLGARDGRAPRGDRPLQLTHPLLFGGPSHTWRGGPAYLDTRRPGGAVGRAWRVTRQQLEDVVAQENGLAPGAVTISDAVMADGGVVLPGSRYGRIVPVASPDELPAVTFTFITPPEPRAPDPAYVALLRAGMAEMGLSDAAATRALGDLDPPPG